jgi:hypothetical protein
LSGMSPASTTSGAFGSGAADGCVATPAVLAGAGAEAGTGAGAGPDVADPATGTAQAARTAARVAADNAPAIARRVLVMSSPCTWFQVHKGR